MSAPQLDDDVFAALLALDAYNREYQQGVELDPTMTGLGHATFLMDVDQIDGAPSSFLRPRLYL